VRAFNDCVERKPGPSTPGASRGPWRPRLSLLFIATAVLVPLLAGCPGHLGPEFPLASAGGTPGGGGVAGTDGTPGLGGATAAACDAPALIFAPTCAKTAGCHSSSDFLDLSGDDVAVRLIGKPETLSPKCADMNLVNTTAPPDGVLFKLLTDTTCGPMMPLGGAPLSPEQLTCLQAWVASKL